MQFLGNLITLMRIFAVTGLIVAIAAVYVRRGFAFDLFTWSIALLVASLVMSVLEALLKSTIQRDADAYKGAAYGVFWLCVVGGVFYIAVTQSDEVRQLVSNTISLDRKFW